LGRPAAMLWTLAFIIVLHVPFLLVPKIRGLPAVTDARPFLSDLWQVSATLLSISFVILVFVVETIHRSAGGGFVWQRFVRQSGLFPIVGLFVGTIVAIGIGSFVLLPSNGLPHAAGLVNVVALDGTLFLAAVLALVWLYQRAFHLADPAARQRLAMGALLDSVQRSVSSTLMLRIEDRILRERCSALGLSYHPSTDQWSRMLPINARKSGVIEDVNLNELGKLGRMLLSKSEPRGLVAIGTGRFVVCERSALVLVPPTDHRELGDRLAKQVSRCFKIVRPGPAAVLEIDTAFSYLTEQAFGCIDSGRLEDLRGVLRGLREPIRVALETFRSYGMTFDAETAAAMFSFEWPVLERPFLEFQRVLERGVRSTDANVVLEVAFWPDAVMELAVQEQDHFFYNRAIYLLPQLYRMSNDLASPASRKLLRDRAWRHLCDFGASNLRRRLRSLTEHEHIDSLFAYCSVLLSAYVTLLRIAIDNDDLEYLHEAGSGFWRCMDIESSLLDTGLGADPSLALEMDDDLTDLQKAKAAFLVRLAERKATLWMELGGWVCHQWARSQISSMTAKGSFQYLSARFVDFSALWKALGTALAASRLELHIWEMEHVPEGEVVSIGPERSVGLFFSLVALANVPDQIHERLHTLAVLEQANWAKMVVNGALDEIKANAALWNDLMNVDRSGQEAEIRELMDAAEADEKIRERQHIMEQPVSATKIAEFKTEFTTAWEAGSLCRRLLKEIGGVEYSAAETVRSLIGYWRMLPKGAFVDDPGSVAWVGFGGSSFGAGVARAENDLVWDTIRKSARRQKLGRSSVSGKLSQIIERLTASGFPPDVIRFSGKSQILRHLELSEDYVPRWGGEGTGTAAPRGAYKGIPLYWGRLAEESEFLVVSLRRIGRLVQYATGEDAIFRSFQLTSYTLEEAKHEAIENRSRLPKDWQSKSEDDIVDLLRDSVCLRIEEALEMRVEERSAARLLVVPRPLDPVVSVLAETDDQDTMT